MSDLEELRTPADSDFPNTSEDWKTEQGIAFSILRRGATEPGGPYTEEEVLYLLKENNISKQDYVFFQGLSDWRPLEEVFEVHEKITHFVDDGQDKYKLGEAFREVSQILSPNEEIYYIAIQNRAGILTKTRQCVIITNQHLYHLTEKRVGYELEAHDWGSISNTKMNDDKKEVGTFSFLINNDRRVDIPHIPMAQVRRLFELSCEMKVR